MPLADLRRLLFPSDDRSSWTKYAPDTPGGSVFHAEGEFLADAARNWGGPVVQYGSMAGISDRYILSGLCLHDLDPFAVLYSVDINHQWNDETPRRVVVAADSADWRVPVCPVWAFVDGDHSYKGVCADIARLLQSGCERLLFHDCLPALQGQNDIDVRRAVLDRLGDWHKLEATDYCGLLLAARTLCHKNEVLL